MEPKKVKKLVIRKEDISYLNNPAQNQLRGGYGILSIFGNTCNGARTCNDEVSCDDSQCTRCYVCNGPGSNTCPPQTTYDYFNYPLPTETIDYSNCIDCIA